MIESSVDVIEPSVDVIEPSVDAIEPSVDAIEPSVDAIESAVHLGTQITNVGTDLTDRRGVLLAAAFQVSDTLFKSSHSRASLPGRHGPGFYIVVVSTVRARP